VPWQGELVLEPQGTLFFLLLMVAFGGLLIWLVLARLVVFRLLAACLAFLPAMVFGIAAVNKYYDYYQTWGALFSDLSGQSTQEIPQVSAAGLGQDNANSINDLIKTTNAAYDSQTGYLFRTVITGPRSHITREVYVYLPPQYFSKAWTSYRFPVIELLHGSPGDPEAWVNVLNVIPIFLQLMAQDKASPAVLVMPDTDGGEQYGLQCLNNPHGLQDMTFVADEVPNWVSAHLRVQRPGGAWGIAGYSEGGYCAANIALQHPNQFGYSGVMSGYFAPITSQVPTGGTANGKPEDVNVFAHYPKLAALNTPMQYILRIPIGVEIPQFWLAAGAEDQGDVQGAESFRQLLLTRDADVPLDIVPGGGHVATVWRSALGPMLEWMTPQLATEVQRFMANEAAARAAAKAAAAAHAKDHHKAKKPRSATHTLHP
jgi:enterochelin esterase-like enzyme